MDLANYLSELLGQHGQVSFPGLGNFVRVRVNGYYNDNEGKFYPPYHQVKFHPEATEDDDTFALYVARKKNISLASSKYFAEKYTSKLKEQAALNELAFADLGWFSSDQSQLVFKPNDRITADPSFYGFEPLSVSKLPQPSPSTTIKTIYAEPERPPIVPPVQPYEPASQQVYEEEEIEPKKRVSIWMILMILLLVAALALFGIYKFYPDLFDKFKNQYHRITDREAAAVVIPVAAPVVKPDTVKKAVRKDTVVTTAAQQPAADSAANAAVTSQANNYALLGPAFKTRAEADAAIKFYRRYKIAAALAANVPGPLFKITFGTYPALEAAQSAKKKLIRTGKLSDTDITILPYN